MTKLDSYKDVISRNNEPKKKGITTLKVAISGGTYHYGSVIPDTNAPVAPPTDAAAV